MFGWLIGKDVIGLAQTGSGKTGAFAIPIIQALLETPQPFFACVLSPTRFVRSQLLSWNLPCEKFCESVIMDLTSCFVPHCFQRVGNSDC